MRKQLRECLSITAGPRTSRLRRHSCLEHTLCQSLALQQFFDKPALRKNLRRGSIAKPKGDLQTRDDKVSGTCDRVAICSITYTQVSAYALGSGLRPAE